MALILEKHFDNGIILAESYVKVSNIRGDKTGLAFTVFYYNSQQSYRDGLPCVACEDDSFIPSSDDSSARWDKQIYEYLKAKPEFVNAIDVLEDGQTA